MELEHKNIVFYHANCNDGIFAAVNMKEYLEDVDGIDISLLPLSYGHSKTLFSNLSKLEEETDKDIRVWFVDFCPSIDDIRQLSNLGYDTFILDHHRTAREALESLKDEKIDNVFFHINNDKCGSLLTFNISLITFDKDENDLPIIQEQSESVYSNLTVLYKLSEDENISDFYKLLDIRDRWVETIPELKVDADIISSYLFSHDVARKGVHEAIRILRDVKHSLNDVLMEGQSIYEHEQRTAKREVSKIKPIRVKNDNGVEIKVGFTSTTTSISNMADYFRENEDGPVVLFNLIPNLTNECWNISARSNQHFNVRKLFELFVKYGVASTGGGHNQAAGTSITGSKTISSVVDLIMTYIQHEANLIEEN